jgi:hypothetical protein
VAPVTGYIKLWRQMRENGHFNIPDIAFKLWLYFLVRAAYEPQPKWGISAGESWVSYEDIQEECSDKEEATRLSTRTISRYLTYLEKHGYITRCRLGLGKGMKIRVNNWERYQGDEASSSTPLPATVPSKVESKAASKDIQESIKKDKEDIKATRKRPAPKPKKESDPRIKIILDHYAEGFELTFGTKPIIPNYAQAGSLAKKLLAVYDVDKLDDLLYEFFHTDDKWVQEKAGYTFSAFYYTVTKLLSKGGRKQ